MVKRDLKADLELCNEATPGPWEAEDGLADPMVVMGRDYSHYFYVHTEWDAQFIAQAREGWPHAIERAIKAEEIVQDLTRVLRLYEKWEIDLEADHALWQSASGLPFITQEVFDEWVRIQVVRNGILVKAEEVLGDER